MPPPSRPCLLSLEERFAYWFAVSFCVQVARGNKSRLMGQGGGCFLLNQPFFFPNQGIRREREDEALSIYLYSNAFTGTLSCRDLTLEVWIASFIRWLL